MPEFCLVSLRNLPRQEWTPAFVAWPLTAEHIQAAVAFAQAHNMSVCVAASGHDFLNRHSCDQGVMIRTTLMKDISFDTSAAAIASARAAGNTNAAVKGVATFGAGVNWGEALQACKPQGLVVPTGHAATVGVVGWGLGGGHSFIGPRFGLGADNMVAVDIVLANGTLVTANATSHSRLFWALRGGGGSAFGVVVAMHYSAYGAPEEGFTAFYQVISGRGDDAGVSFRNMLDKFQSWSLSRSSKWGGALFTNHASTGVDNNTEVNSLLGAYGIHNCSELAAVYGLNPDKDGCNIGHILASPACKASPSCLANPTFMLSACPETCKQPWASQVIYEYIGAPTDAEFTAGYETIATISDNTWAADPPKPFATYWDKISSQPLEDIVPLDVPQVDVWSYGGSVLVNRSVASSGAAADYAEAYSVGDACIKHGACAGFQFYQTVPGASDSPAPKPGSTAVSSGFRDAVWHMLAYGPFDDPSYYPAFSASGLALGANSYMSESALNKPGTTWKARNWGDNYAELLRVKQLYDPDAFFWCFHCVGSDWVPGA